jgi:hypothetical protein
MTLADFDGYLHAADGRIVTGRGDEVLLRGMGLGNWLLPEGYMWKFEPPGPQSPREIEALVVDLVGKERALEFWRGFRDRFVTEDDIARIAAEGMDHVRLPLNARLLITPEGEPIEDGFALIDRCVEWCREHRLWVVLDLHGAPGGQTGTNIDDSLGTPALFEDDHNRWLTLRLWRMLAERYRDETVVAGYDLLNEPLPNEYQHTYAERLVSLYRELTDEIRAVDPHHMIIYEGSHWATNWSVFTEVWDPNSVLQFHKYWSPPDRPTIQGFIDVGARLGLPIWMGEGGENNLDWFQTAFQLYEDHSIGWNFWPWKKIETLTSPCSVTAPSGWTAIVDYAAQKGERPDAEDAWRTLRELLDNVDLSRCHYRNEVVSAVLRRAPLRLPATGFGFKGPGVSHQCADPHPLRGFRGDDQVTVRLVSGGEEPEEHDFHQTGGAPRPESDAFVVVLAPGDWVAYGFDTVETRRLDVRIVLAGDAASSERLPLPDISIDRTPVDDSLNTAGSAFHATTRHVVEAGRHTLRVTGRAAQTLLRLIEIT